MNIVTFDTSNKINAEYCKSERFSWNAHKKIPAKTIYVFAGTYSVTGVLQGLLYI